MNMNDKMPYIPINLTEDFCKKHEIMVRYVTPRDREAIQKFLPIQKGIFDLVFDVSGMIMVSRIRGWTFYLIYPKVCDILVYDFLMSNGYSGIT